MSKQQPLFFEAFDDLFQEGEREERERILAVLQDHVCPSCEEHFARFGLDPILQTPFPHSVCEGLLSAIDLIKEATK